MPSTYSKIQYLGPAHELSKQRRRWIADGLIAGLPNHRIDDYFTAKPQILRGSSYVAIVSQGNQCVGLCTATDYAWPETPFTYVETLLLAEQEHGGVLATGLLSSVFQAVTDSLENFPDTVAMKTYSAKAYSLMRRFVTRADIDFYPRLTASNSMKSMEVAIRVAAALSPTNTFDVSSGVVGEGGGAVPDDFWPVFPVSRDSYVNNYIKSHMTPSDRLLCLVIAETFEAKRELLINLNISRSMTHVRTSGRRE